MFLKHKLTRPPPPAAAPRLGSLQRLDRRVRRDHVAAAVAVEPDRSDRLADLEVRVGLDDALGREHGLERPDRDDLPRRQRPGAGGQEADCERLLEARQHEVVVRLVPERLPQRNLDEVDADCVADEVGHLSARDPGRDLDDPHRAVVGDDQLREGDPVAQPERVHGVHGDPLRLGEHVARRSRRDRRGSSRRRSRSPAGAAGRKASAGTHRHRARSRSRSARARRGSSRRSPRPSATRRVRHARVRRARPSTRRRRSRAGRPSRRASAPPARRPRRALRGRSACRAPRRSGAAARPRLRACGASRSCGSSDARSRCRFRADPAPPRRPRRQERRGPPRP